MSEKRCIRCNGVSLGQLCVRCISIWRERFQKIQADHESYLDSSYQLFLMEHQNRHNAEVAAMAQQKEGEK